MGRAKLDQEATPPGLKKPRATRAGNGCVDVWVKARGDGREGSASPWGGVGFVRGAVLAVAAWPQRGRVNSDSSNASFRRHGRRTLTDSVLLLAVETASSEVSQRHASGESRFVTATARVGWLHARPSLHSNLYQASRAAFVHQAACRPQVPGHAGVPTKRGSVGRSRCLGMSSRCPWYDEDSCLGLLVLLLVALPMMRASERERRDAS